MASNDVRHAVLISGENHTLDGSTQAGLLPASAIFCKWNLQCMVGWQAACDTFPTRADEPLLMSCSQQQRGVLHIALTF